MNRIIKLNKNKWITRLTLSVIFVGMLVLNILTPMVDDDYALGYFKNVKDVLRTGIHDYFWWNGRFFAQTNARIFNSFVNSYIFDILNAFLFIFLIVLIDKFTSFNTHNAKYSATKIVVIFCLIWLFVPSFGQVFLWETGSITYLWGMVASLLYLYCFVRFKNERNKFKIFSVSLFMIFLGIFVGFSSENNTGAILILLFSFFAVAFRENKLKVWMILVSMINIAAYACLILAPGNKNRIRIALGAEFFKKSIIVRSLDGLVEVLNNFKLELIPLCTVFIILFVVKIIYFPNLKSSIRELIIFVSGLASVFVLLFSPLGNGGRSFFGGTVLIILSIIDIYAQMFQENSIFAQDNVIKLVFSLFLVSITTITLINGVIGSYDIAQTYYSEKNRIEIIKNTSKKNIKLEPLVRPKTKYSAQNGLQDIGNNADIFPNNGYYEYFGVKVERK